jgi:hypothetical protein
MNLRKPGKLLCKKGNTKLGCYRKYTPVSVRKGSFSALGLWDRLPTWPLPSAVAAEA